MPTNTQHFYLLCTTQARSLIKGNTELGWTPTEAEPKLSLAITSSIIQQRSNVRAVHGMS